MVTIEAARQIASLPNVNNLVLIATTGIFITLRDCVDTSDRIETCIL